MNIDILKKMTVENPDNGSAWFLLGMEYSQLGLVSEALQAFSEVLRLGDDELKQKVMFELPKLAKISQTGVNPKNDDEKESLEDINSIKTAKNEMDMNKTGEEPVILHVIDGGKKVQTGVKEKEKKETATFADVGGLDELKDIIKAKIVKPFIEPGLYERFKKKVGGGVLLFGPPGCGKTYIAKATAGECHAKFIPVHISDILDPYIGVSERNVQDIFASARTHTPCILFFDELDALGYSRAKGSKYTRSLVDQLLSEIDGIDTSIDKILIIGATNMPWDVDSAFKRPGRFDKLVFVQPPDKEAREVIFKLKLANRPSENIVCSTLAERTELFSGADIENVVELATQNVIDEILKTGNERSLSTKDLLSAIDQSRPSTIEWLRTIKNYTKYANQGGLYDDVEKFFRNHRNI